jgi:hypothetical protein
MGYAQDLLDEIEYDTCYTKTKSGREKNTAVFVKFKDHKDIIELEVEEELHKSIAKELKGKLSSKCAQKLIDSQ